MRNKQNLNKWQKAYYQKKKDDPDYKAKRRAAARKYYHANKDKYREKQKRHIAKNPERYREYRRDYKAFSPRGIYSGLKSGAKKRGIAVAFTVDEFVKWWNEQPQICYYCKRSFELIKSIDDAANNRARRLTIDRIDSSQAYLLGNIRLACYRCNQVKSDYFTAKEMLEIGKIINVKIP